MTDHIDHRDMVFDLCGWAYVTPGDEQILKRTDIDHIYNIFLLHVFYYVTEMKKL